MFARRFFSFALFTLFGLPLLCQAAITIDSASSQNTGANTSTTLPLAGYTWMHTVSGSNTILVVGVSINQTASKQSVSSISYNGSALARIGTAVKNNNTQVEIWYRVGPAAGTNDIVVTLTAAARFTAGAISFAGVDQANPLGTFASGSGNTNAPSTTVTSAADELVVDVLGYADSSANATAGTGQTQQWTNRSTNGTPGNNAVGYSSTKTGAASVAMSWTFPNKQVWAMGAVPLKPAVNPFSYRKQITVDRTKVGVTGTSATTLSNYPFLINVTDANLKTVANGGFVQNSNGYDIIFRGVNDAVCGGTGTNPCTLSHQIEKYDATTGTLAAWIKLPSVNTNAASSNTTFYMYFGNVSVASSSEDAAGVWDSNFQAVWHMSDNAATTTVAQSTSVTTIGDGVAAANTSTKTATGQIAGALTFNGSSDYIYQTGSTAISNPQGYTLSAWVQTTTASGRKVIGFEGARTLTASASYDRMIWIGTDGYAYAGCYNGSYITSSSNSSVTGAAWHYLVAQLDDSDDHVHLFVDGVRQNTYTAVGGACETTTGYWRMGSYKTVNWAGGATDGYFTGSIDEARISSTIRSADWIITDYNNQSSPSTFYSVGSLETSPITLVELISFTATNYSGLVQLKWSTGYEIDNLGFRIYREDGGGLTRVTPSMVAGSALLAGEHIALTAGRTYIWQDFVGSASKPFRYWLEDVDTKGKSTWHGPVVAVAAEGDLPQQVQSVVLGYLGKGASRIQSNGSQWSFWNKSVPQAVIPAISGMNIEFESASIGKVGATQELLFASGGVDGSTAAASQIDPVLEASVKIKINRQGWYRLSQPQLMQAGLSPLVNPRNLQLYVDGVEQPIAVFACGGLTRVAAGQSASAPQRGANALARRDCEGEFGVNDWIEFYATGADTIWTDTRAYWLVEGAQPGKRIPIVDGSTASSGPSSVLTTIEFKPKTIYWAELRNGDGDNFFGSVISVDGAEEILPLSHLDLLTSKGGSLQVRLQGVTEDMSHAVRVELNGSGLGTMTIDGRSTATQLFSLPPGLLVPGDNDIRFLALNGEDDISLIEYLRLSYWRTPDADSDFLPLTAAGNQELTIGGFTNPAIRVVDITDPLAMTEVTGTIAPKDGWYAITALIKGSGMHNLIAFTAAAVQSPASVAPNKRSGWSNATGGANVVIISHPDFVSSLQPLKAQQQAEGYSVAVVDVEDLYDEFNRGQKSPYALKDFLAKASTDWTIKPSFLLLVGDASFDPRNYLGLGDFDYLPTKLIDTQFLETASDDWFADFNDDGIPEIAVGRISARTPAEADSQIAKIVAFRQVVLAGSAGSWADQIVLVADRNDGFDFEAASNQLSDEVPDLFSVSKIYRGQMTDTTARSQVLQSLNSGALLINYLGHGSVELWRGNMLTSEDAAGLTNGTKLPLVVSMNCLNGYFSDIYTESLAEALMKAPNGGAIGVWAASGLSDPQLQLVMNQEFATNLLNSGQTVGESIVKAKSAVNDKNLRKTWIFFGDPTIKMPF